LPVTSSGMEAIGNRGLGRKDVPGCELAGGVGGGQEGDRISADGVGLVRPGEPDCPERPGWRRLPELSGRAGSQRSIHMAAIRLPNTNLRLVSHLLWLLPRRRHSAGWRLRIVAGRPRYVPSCKCRRGSPSRRAGHG
jgi:hypothetical protein